jgi:hypothetical protein
MGSLFLAPGSPATEDWMRRTHVAIVFAFLLGLFLGVLVTARRNVRVPDSSPHVTTAEDVPRPLPSPMSVPPPAPASAQREMDDARGERRRADDIPSVTAQSPRRDPEVDWATVPVDQLGGLYAFGRETAQQVTDQLFEASLGAHTSCLADGRWTPPPGVKTWTATFELRVSPTNEGLEVTDAVLLSANVAVSELEECFRKAYVGKVIPVDDATSLQRTRLWWPIRITPGPMNREAAAAALAERGLGVRPPP